MSLRRSILPMLSLSLLTACAASGSAPECADGAFPMARLELYFGTQRPGGAPVTDAEWAAFLDQEVTPRFPDGLTVLEGNGQWRDSKGVVTRESSTLLIVLYEPTAGKDSAIEDIRAAYKDRFDQESVLRVDAGTQCVSF